jgi:hypothetical protein
LPVAGARAGSPTGTASDSLDADSLATDTSLTSPELARACVAAAWRTAGLGADDAAIDDLVSRSRASALFPETRLRAMRLWDDAAHATTLATTNDTTYYDAIGANLVLEVRLTWRLDRLLYAGDEASLERVRLERKEARARLAARTLEALFAWRRARVDAWRRAQDDAWRRAQDDAWRPARDDARLPTGRDGRDGDERQAAATWLQVAEAEATLDVLTGGWFSTRDPPSPPP